MSSPRKKSGLAVAAIVSLLLTGCGYHTAGAPAHMPANAHLLDVPLFINHTQQYHAELTMTQAVLKAFQGRTAFRVESKDDIGDADAVLRGEITGFKVFPLTYDTTTTQSSSYLITVTARVRLLDRTGRVLFQNPSYVFRQQYESSQDLASFIQEDPAAMDRLSRDFAETLVADITESW